MARYYSGRAFPLTRPGGGLILSRGAVRRSFFHTFVFALFVGGPALAQESTYDHDVLRTKSGDTLREGTGRTTLEFEYFRMPDDGHALIAPRILALYGFSDWAQGGIQFDGRSIDGDGDFSSSGWGAGDPVLTARFLPWEAENWLFGADVAFKVPSADNGDGLGSDEGDGIIRGIIHRRFDDWRLSINLGMGFLGDNGDLAEVDGFFLWGLAAEYVVDEQWRLMGEFSGTVGGDVNRNIAGGDFSRDEVRGRLGVVFAPAYDWTVGVSAEGGLTSRAPDCGFLFSVSKLWGAREDGKAQAPSARPARLDPASRPSWLLLLNPLDTDVAQTIPEGQGAAFGFFGPRRQADGTRLWAAPRVGATFGLGARADATVSLDHRILEGGSTPPRFRNQAGFGDMNLRLRFVPIESDFFRGGLGLGGKIPLRSAGGLTTGEIDVTMKVLVSFLLDGWRMHANFGYAIEGDPLARSEQNDFMLWSLAAEVPVCDCLTILGEVSGSDMSADVPNVGLGANGNDVVEGRLGLLGPIGDGWTWTVAGSKGVTNDSPDWQVEFGIGHLFGD